MSKKWEKFQYIHFLNHLHPKKDEGLDEIQIVIIASEPPISKNDAENIFVINIKIKKTKKNGLCHLFNILQEMINLNVNRCEIYHHN